MILIADSGSTKVDWRVLCNNGEVKSISTEGINPVFLTPEKIEHLLRNKLLTEIGPDVTDVYFYGAGVVSPKISDILSLCFKSVFPKSVCYSASDVLAAARALCGHNPGIACIIGTGSNSCFYDGQNILKNVRAGGFILGDEASGAVLGRKLVSDFIKGLLPAEIEKEFIRRYKLDYGKVVDLVYRQSMPSRFLASFSPFINEFSSNPYFYNLISSSFDDFFKRNIIQYDYKHYNVNFVGSIAYYYRNILKEIAQNNGATIGKIIKSPIEGLIDFHSNKI